MSRTIDERVVEMRFDNAQFENNIRTSISTLGELKNALNMDGVTKSLDSIDKAANGIDLSGISAGIEALQDRFSTLGIIGMRVIENLTDTAMNFGSKVVGFFTSGVIQGGINRAMNIEQAKFQLEGLSVAWEDISDDINYGVKDTAYGLDAAAKAASQLVTSGVEFGETFGTTGNSPMAKALRGISGVAAMTNSEYSDIARIFTTVAGNGRLMTQQLNQLGYKGLNTAGQLAKFFNSVVEGDETLNVSEDTMRSMANALEEYGATAEITESDIREMVTKGLISFDIFSEAMDSAFGLHAKEANKTFSGAMKNIKAALSRVGADFVTPLIETDSSLVKFLNTVRTKVDSFRTMTTREAGGITDTILGFIDKLSTFVANMNLARPFYAFKNVVGAIKNVFVGLWSIIKPIGEALGEVFNFKIMSTNVVKITKAIKDFTAKFKLTDEAAENLKRTFKGLFSAIDLVGRVVDTVLRLFGKLLSFVLPPLGKAVAFVMGKILQFTGFIGDLINSIDGLIKNNEKITKTFSLLKDIVSLIGDSIKIVFSGIFSSITKFVSSTVAVKDVFLLIGDSIKNVFARGINAASNVLSSFTFDLTSFKEFFTRIFEASKQVVTDLIPNSVINNLKFFKDNIAQTFDNSKRVISEFISNAIEPMKEDLEPLFVEFAKKFSSIKTRFSHIGNNVKEVFESLVGMLKTFFGSTDELGPSLDKLRSKIKLLFASLKGFFTQLPRNFSDLFKNIKMFLNGGFKTPDLSKLASFKDKASTIFETIGKNVSLIFSKFKEFASQKIKAPDLSGLIKLKDIFLGVLSSIKTAIANSLKKLPELISKIDLTPFLEKVKGAFESINKAIKKIFEQKSGVNSSLASMFSLKPLEDFKNAFIETIKNIFNEFRGLTENMTLEDIAGTLLGFLVGKEFLNALKSISNVGNEIKQFLKDVASPFKKFGGIGDSIAKVLKTATTALNEFANSLKGDLILKIAIAIGILTVALIALSHVDAEKLIMPLAAVSVLLGEMIVLMAVLNKTSTATSTSISKKGILTSGITRMTGTIIAIGVTVIALSKALTILSDIDPNKLKTSLTAFSFIMGELTVLIAVLNKTNSNAKIAITQGLGYVGLGIAIGKMAEVVKSLSELAPKALKRGLDGFTTIMLELLIFLKMVENNDNVLKASASLVIIGAALMIMAGVIATLGSIPWQVAVRGLAWMFTALMEISLMMYIVKKVGNSVRTAASMVIIGAALMIIAGVIATLGSIKWSVAIRGLKLMAVALGEIVIALNLLKNVGNSTKSAASMVILGAALLVIAGAITVLGNIPWKIAAQGLIVMGSALLIFVVAANLARGCEGVMITLAGSLALLGLAVALVGGGLLALAIALEIISVTGAAAAYVLGESMAIMFNQALDTIINSSEKLKEAIITLIQIAMDTLVESTDVICDGLFEMLIAALDSLLEYTPVITEKAVDILMSFMDALIPKLPELTDKAIELFGIVYSKLAEYLNSVDYEPLVSVLKFIGLLGAIGLASIAVGKIALKAIVPLLKVSAFGAVLSAIIAAFGALNQIPGYAWLIEEGGEIITTIGDILGRFFGGIVGNFAEGITSVLPQIGQDFSDFMDNISGFIQGSSAIQAGTFDGVKTLAETMILLTAEDLLNGLTSFLTGGKTSLSDFGKELGKFAPFYLVFARAISAAKIDNEKIDASARCIETMAMVASMIGNQGGVLADVIGDNTLSQFGQELVKFGPYIVRYSKTVKNHIDEEAVESSANALKIIAAAADTIPNQGGALADAIGDNTLSQFGKELLAFGPSIVRYSKTVKNHIDEEAVESSANALRIISAAADAIPNQGGALAYLIGDNTLSQFGKELLAFAPRIVRYSKTVKGHVDEDAVKASANALDVLIALSNDIPNNGGVLSWFTGNNDIDKFGESLATFGTYLSDYSDSIEGIDADGMDKAAAQMFKLIDIADGVQGIDSFSVSNFAYNMKTYAINGLNGFIEAFTDRDAEATVESSISTMVGFVNSALINEAVNLKEYGNTAGQDVVTGIQEGFANKDPDIKSSTADLCLSIINKTRDTLTKKIFETYASVNVCGGLISGINQKTASVLSTIKSLSNSINITFKLMFARSRFLQYGANVVEGFSTGIQNNEKDVVNHSSSICNSVIRIFNSRINLWTLYKNGQNAIQGLVNGMNSKLSTAVNEANRVAQSLDESVKKALGIRSPSKIMYENGRYICDGLANGIRNYSDSVNSSTEYMANEAIVGVQAAIALISTMIEDGINSEPTITPVMDLTNIQNGIHGMNGLFANGINVSRSYANALNAGATYDDMIPGQAGSVMNNYNYTQNNYSPKALSRIEIYRQTKNQFASLKGVVSSS